MGDDSHPVRLGVDVGGTFTDVALVVDGDLTTAKVPTTTPQHAGVLDGVREACDAAGIDPADVGAFAHATTVSVNALLERDGARTALVTTAGFRDVLEIGRQTRPALYDLDAEKPVPLVPRRRRFEVDERATTEGIERPVDPESVRGLADEIAESDAESVAVSLLHAYAHPENEAVVTELLREELEVPVSASHDVLAEFREFERTATTAADAYLTPELDDYLGRIVSGAEDLGLPEPRVMRSNGGVADAETVRESAVTTVLSGPAAGVVGAAAVAGGATLGGEEPDGASSTSSAAAVTFDMGGTSSDVSLVRDGRAERAAETTIAGVPLRTPTVDVETVGAGGGSIAWTDAGGALRVGPESAGAEPGPACYGTGGTDPTVTDADVLLGYIGPDAALGGDLALDVDAAREALERLADAAGIEGDDGLGAPAAAARGVYRVANATMARAIRSVTVERGRDPRAFDLVAFGGAGPMHAAALADRLGMERVLVPGPAGVLSAYGLLAADETHDAARTVRLTLAESTGEGAATAGDLGDAFAELTDRVLADASEPEAARVELAADCRYAGQSFELTVDAGGGGSDGAADPGAPPAPAALAERFAAAHERAYGYRLDAAVEAVTLRVAATVEVDPPVVSRTGAPDAKRGAREVVFSDAGAVEATVYDRDALGPEAALGGPAVLAGTESTTVVPPGWGGRVRRDGTVALERTGGSEGAAGGDER
ncbi:hydantoinase/oxoprolinase family protein [Halorubrum lipolyticum]|uniref:5-oxoprolinase n=1 Tax=Halorubrum lipolyticum DSM 21995 TaxID=1227482 RepID=M0NUG0_9EURY|nr:hydantoinase/oxoprolinase family protein [Halorubrum lipolyticum]EMA61416.1 5-oxoprolinase [Halorubrum lipolyticum DSM 21995]